MATVVCYGDSNTYGVNPATGGRHPREVRWPRVLERELDGSAEVIEEGLSGRTTIWDDPFTEYRNGRPYLLPCLRSHAPVEVLVLLLGTNDLKSIFARQAHEIALGCGTLVDVATASGTGPDGAPPRVLVVTPPRLGPATDRSELWGFGDARARRDELPRLYRAMADLKGAAFVDAGSLVAGDPGDGVHLGVAEHGVLGRAIAAAVRELL